MSPPAATERDSLLKDETQAKNKKDSFNPVFRSQESEYESDESPDVYATIRVLDVDKEPKVPLHFEVNPSAMKTTFLEDLKGFSPGSMPHSTVVGTTIGLVCGVVAFCYYSVLEFLLDVIWHDLPERFLAPYVPESWHWLWIVGVGLTMAVLVGLSVKLLGEPGDLSYTVQCVHDRGFIHMDHVLPMLAASQFSILGGGSLGPEAPLVAICASFSGFISRKIFKMQSMNLIRKHTLMGMACALAAFFGVPLGGSLFALEINNRFGIEYYEHTVEAIFSGTVCVCVFRGLAGLTLGPIWFLQTDDQDPLGDSTPLMVALGGLLGLLGAAVAGAFASFHKQVMGIFKSNGLLDDSKAVYRALCGAIPMLIIAVFIPQTMFWGEEEIQTIATASPASELPHVYPTGGLIGFEMNSFWTAMILGAAKMIAISFTVAAGFRGGFIFPFFTAGAAFGKGLSYVFPHLSPIIASLCIAAGINVSITRTALATTLILTALSGESNALPPVLASSMVALFVTSYMPFIRSQVRRTDIRYETIPEEP